MSLIDLVQVIAPDREEEPEDIFAAAPMWLFPDDTVNMHGDPESLIVYKSSRFGEIRLQTADPNKEDERRLFSHYLWNAGLKLAELISQPKADSAWSVHDERVVELGVGLGGIVAMLAGASEVAITDYPAPVVLENILRNVDANLLCDSMLHFLSPDSAARVFAVAGFHTGRARLAAFFKVAAEHGLIPEEIYEEDVNGLRRSWAEERDGGLENHTERKKWLVVSRLRKKPDDAG
nr:hypothetical protein B0A51_11288 [Rachicladosporium sp. CCFEE 5018]OQO21817.1 hypothetical protein B0A51_09837 [Rachicladosporium sp. CCFEE 5018]